MSRRWSSPEEAFWNYAEPEPNTGCWLWHGWVGLKGYGRFLAKGKPYRAHRFSYELHNGPIPQGMFVCHSCDNVWCVNPGHLWVGTVQDNVDDMIRKGRQAVGVRRGGKLDDDKVREIRSSVSGDAELAIRYGVSRRVIHHVRARTKWRHVTDLTNGGEHHDE